MARTDDDAIASLALTGQFRQLPRDDRFPFEAIEKR